MKAEELVKKLTLKEKAALVAGTRFMYTRAVERLNIPALETSDGPHGVRKQRAGADNGVSVSEPATAFPPAVTIASGWNEENAERMGEAIAEECRHYGVGVLLAPGANIKRNPRAGRNFEYFSEDPLLAGSMASAVIRGVQRGGAGVSLKHFALNNAENFRFMGNSVADMRAMREIYLKAFERAVAENPASLMCAYNRINGVFASENEWLLNELLRKEWGYRGLVMTDWGATHDRIKGLAAGCDLEMPGDTAHCRRSILKGIKKGTLDTAKLDSAVCNVLRLVEEYGEPERAEADFEAHNRLAFELAVDCAVLLKNDGALPLCKEEKLLVAGGFFERLRYQGAGSSMVNPTRITSVKDAFDQRGIRYVYEEGYREDGRETDEALIASAVQSAKHAEKLVVFAGLSDFDECEGKDRENLSLPEGQLALISALIKTGKPVVVVLFSGSVAELPFADGVSAVLHMQLPGQNGGTATAALLFGERCPSGRLAESWVYQESDIPFDSSFSVCPQEVYKESVFVGYRYYTSANKKVRYPFGYGLSYTSFAYSDMKAEVKDGTVLIGVTLQNTGERAGAEVVQLYVHAPRTDVFRPVRELCAFRKVYLEAGQKAEITLSVNTDELRYFHVGQNRWTLEEGDYEFQLCRNAHEVELTSTLFLTGEKLPSPYSQAVTCAYTRLEPESITDELFEEMSGLKITPLPPKRPLTVESRFTDFKSTFFGRILFRAVLGMAKRKRKRANKLKDGNARRNALKGAYFLEKVLESGCPRSMSMSAGGRMPYNYAEGITHLANGRLFKAIWCFLKRKG